MTLDALIADLEGRSQSATCRLARGIDEEIASPGRVDSWRGSYSEVAIEPCGSDATVADLLARLKAIRGTTMHGYKGGEYKAHGGVSVYVNAWGSYTPQSGVVKVVERDGYVDLLWFRGVT